jgi:hypothetical protein
MIKSIEIGEFRASGRRTDRFVRNPFPPTTQFEVLYHEDVYVECISAIPFANS